MDSVPAGGRPKWALPPTPPLAGFAARRDGVVPVDSMVYDPAACERGGFDHSVS